MKARDTKNADMLSYSLTFGAYSAAFPSAEFTYIPYISFSLSKIRLLLPGRRCIFLRELAILGIRSKIEEGIEQMDGGVRWVERGNWEQYSAYCR